MPSGVDILQYPQQPPPAHQLDWENSYFLVRLHDAQAVFEAGWLAKPAYLILTSAIESSFQPGQRTQNLHQVSMVNKNIPNHLGFQVNLTDWLPARRADWLRIYLKYAVTQDTPIKNMLDKVQKLDLVAKLSLVRPDWAVALKMTEVVTRLLSFIIREGETSSVFEMTIDLNLSDLKTGYYAVYGSPHDLLWPRRLTIDEQGRLKDEDQRLNRLCYTVIKVMSIPRRGPEIAREEGWYELLQTGKDQVLSSRPSNERERSKVLNDWKTTLTQVKAMARKERGFLLEEIKGIIDQAQVEVEAHLLPKETLEAALAQELPEEWQDLLGVQTVEELHYTVDDYRNALKVSKQLMEMDLLQGSP